MTHSRSFLLLAVAIALTAILFSVGSGAHTASADHPPELNPPNIIDVIGDSISRGYSANNSLGESAANLDNNWATGNSSTVMSHYRRLLTGANPAIIRFNHSVSGAKMVNANAQALNVVAANADIVLIEMGGNDVCTSTEANMTTVANYRAQFQQAMVTLTTGLPNARIFVASVPDVWYLWDSNKNNVIARLIWSLGSICQSLLSQPTCVTAACNTRRANVRQRAHDFSVQLEEVCDQYIHCRFDNYGVNSTPFTAAQINTADYFHPNVAGQTLLAAGTWAASFNYADVTPPSTTLTPDRAPDGIEGWYKNNVTVSLSSADPDLSGTEYFYKLETFMGPTPWIRYTAPFTITSEGITEVHYRSVDVNGNTEEGQEALIKIDKTAPLLDVTCPASPVLHNGPASITVVASDDRSGFDTNPSGVFAADTSVLGPNLHQQTIADKASNTATDSCTFDVQGQADVQVSSTSTDCAASSITNSPFNCTVQTTVHNNGPETPANADVSVSIALPGDCSAVPAGAQTDPNQSLAVSVNLAVSKSWTVTCTLHGTHMITGNATATLDQQYVIDPVSGNNSQNAADSTAIWAPVDIEMVSLSLTSVPATTVDVPFSVQIDVVTKNNSSVSTNVEVGIGLAIPADCTQGPYGHNHIISPVPLSGGQSVPHSLTWSVSCSSAGSHHFIACGRAGPISPNIFDPISNNNHKNQHFDVAVSGASPSVSLGISCSIPHTDTDGDNFADSLESYLGTNSVHQCSTDLNDSAWPPDFNNDKRVNISDILSLKPVFNSHAGVLGFSQRQDLNGDASVNISDVLTLKPLFNTSC